jgi:hypothetical protein
MIPHTPLLKYMLPLFYFFWRKEQLFRNLHFKIHGFIFQIAKVIEFRRQNGRFLPVCDTVERRKIAKIQFPNSGHGKSMMKQASIEILCFIQVSFSILRKFCLENFALKWIFGQLLPNSQVTFLNTKVGTRTRLEPAAFLEAFLNYLVGLRCQN